jgi:hypothetical protein
MPLTRAQILDQIAGPEPDYVAAAAVVGSADLPVLAVMVGDPDVAVAARAASLVAQISQDPGASVAALPALAAAALHPEPSVRAAAAVGASRLAELAAAADLLTALLADADAGVRRMALRSLSTPLPPALAGPVQTASEPPADGGPLDVVDAAAVAVAAQAAALLARQPGGLAFGESLLFAATAYGQARLNELRTEVLDDVTAFVAATGGVVDPAGAVQDQLAAAITSLNASVPKLEAKDFAAAAADLGAALRAIEAAATLSGGPRRLLDLLVAKIGWSGVTVGGLVRALGLPAVPPGLAVEAGCLVFSLSSSGATLVPIPKVAFDAAVLTARVRIDAPDGPPLSASLAIRGIEIDVVPAALAALLGAGSARADITLGLDTTHGFTIGGGATSKIVLPAVPGIGPLDIRELSLELPPGSGGRVQVGSAIATDLVGVVQATIDGAGVALVLDPGAITTGDSPLTVVPLLPTGIGLSVDTGIVRGGGFLDVRDGGKAFGGALALQVGPIGVKAFGLLTLEPDFALVVVLAVEFDPPIDLSFGFTLNAVGGVIGINHRLDPDAMRTAVAAGSLDHLLFPVDPVAAAPAILDLLGSVFPVDEGSVVIGPMIELGWGRPVSFLTAQLGVILSLPDPLVVILGRVRIALPAPDVPIIDLRATVYGEITPDHLLILVSLNGSRIAGFSVDGDIGLLLRWGGSAEFAISAGGFHPQYSPPHELAGMKRLSMDLSPPAILTLRSESYFALTTNSVQFGTHTEMGADLGVASISGHFTFDALVIFSPHFAFVIDLDIGLTVRVFGETLCGVHIALHVEGPAPWRAQGTAEVEILWWTVPIDVGPFTWGEDDNPPPAPADPRALVHAALHRNPGAWQALVPPDADRIVRLRSAAPSDTDVTVHPMGLFDVRQHAVPLETVVTRVGANPVPDGRRRVHLGVPLVNGTPAGALSEVTDLFSAGNFLDLSDHERLSRPSFEPMPAGARIRPPGEAAEWAASREAQLRYETFVCDDDDLRGRSSLSAVGGFFADAAHLTLAAGAAGRSDLRAGARYRTTLDPIVLAGAGEVAKRSKTTLAADVAVGVSTYTRAAEQGLADTEQLVRLGGGV